MIMSVYGSFISDAANKYIQSYMAMYYDELEDYIDSIYSSVEGIINALLISGESSPSEITLDKVLEETYAGLRSGIDRYVDDHSNDAGLPNDTRWPVARIVTTGDFTEIMELVWSTRKTGYSWSVE